jgi:DNA-binding transcriptional regulator YdaS (Cro superfamily)
MDSGLKAAIKAAGGTYKLGPLLGISRQAIEHWHRVPAERVVEVERATGIDRTVLRPDLYERA